MNIEGIIHTAQLIEQVFPDIPARLTNHVIKHELVMVPTQMVGVRAQLENYATEYFACEHMGLFLSYYGRSMIGKDGYLCYCVDGDHMRFFYNIYEGFPEVAPEAAVREFFGLNKFQTKELLKEYPVNYPEYGVSRRCTLTGTMIGYVLRNLVEEGEVDWDCLWEVPVGEVWMTYFHEDPWWSAEERHEH